MWNTQYYIIMYHFSVVYTILYIVYHVYCGMHNIIYCMSLKHVYIKLSQHDAYCGYLETFGDTKGVIRSRKSKDRQHNGQMKKNKQ